MGVSVEIYLWGKPEWELPAEINDNVLFNAGNKFKECLDKIAKNVAILQKNGWEIELGLYDLFCSKDGIDTKKDVIKEFKKLKLNSKDFLIDEYEDEEQRLTMH